MKTDDFDYFLPEELIAQTPLQDRSSSKLMIVDKSTGAIKDEVFSNIVHYLKKGDVLVLNNTKVLPARLYGEKEETRAVIEVLLLKELGNDVWECLVKPARRIKLGTVVSFGNGELKCQCVDVFEEGIVHFKMLYDGIFLELGTFRPVKVLDVTKHMMHTEHFSISSEVAEELNLVKREGRRIISVGTTTTRTLESVVGKYGKFVPCEEDTNIFIYPGYQFKAVDVQITNFHLPKSTLIMLVSAFASKDIILEAYRYAVNNKYRFFSFGDSMFITNDMKKKWYTLGEITDEFVGVKSTPEREAFDADVEAALIGASIKNARKAMNLTQAQLGERVGVQTAQISKIESGRNLTISTIVRVLKALGLSANFSINCEGLTPVTLGNRI